MPESTELPEETQPRNQAEVPDESVPILVPEHSGEGAAEANPEPAEPPPSPPALRGVAPLWHTLLLVVAIVGFSAFGASRGPFSSNIPLLGHYGMSALLELGVVAWALWGLALRGKPLRSILGSVPRTWGAVGEQLLVAGIFWILAMCVLATVGLTWSAVEYKVYQVELKKSQTQPPATGPQAGEAKGKQPAAPRPVPPPDPQEKQLENARNLTRIAPTTFVEGVAWGFLCLLVGFSEELVFRGYLMAQGIAWLRFLPLGVLFSALIFGSAHGYEGIRGMVIIGVYGGLFSVLALYRRTLVPGMIAHAWHDFATGLLLAFVRNYHLLDHLPKHP